MRSITIVVPGRPENPNRIRGHWAKRHAITVKWKTAAARHATAALPAGWEPMRRARMSVVHVVPTRAARDLDNLVAAIKASLDGIVLAGVIADDSDRVLVSASHVIEHIKGVAETRYTFEEEAA
jgi:Holliday junction resolvase RusA-like endonuclease